MWIGAQPTVNDVITAVCRSIDQESVPTSTHERCLLVALVQTIYTTYSNDGIHLRIRTYEALVFVVSWLDQRHIPCSIEKHMVALTW